MKRANSLNFVSCCHLLYIFGRVTVLLMKVYYYYYYYYYFSFNFMPIYNTIAEPIPNGPRAKNEVEVHPT